MTLIRNTFLTLICAIFLSSNLYSQQTNNIRVPSSGKLDSICLQCSEHLKWRRLDTGYYKEYPDKYNQQLPKLEITDSSFCTILEKYVINDTFYNTSFYLLNMCPLSDSVCIFVSMGIFDPSDVSDCQGFFIYKSACFFIQYGLEKFVKQTGEVKDFIMNKYPQVYIDYDQPTDYYILFDQKFVRYFPKWDGGF